MHSAVLFSLLASSALAAPVRLPMPLARRGLPSPLTQPALARRGLLDGLLNTVSDVPIVGDVLDTVGDIPVVGDLVDTTVSLLDPLLDVALGVDLNLEVDTWLTCGLVGGLFGGRNYDLGCTCLGAAGGLLLEVDVEAVVNVAGLDAWVQAEVELGLGFWYPAGARPTCDGTGGWTCPGVSTANAIKERKTESQTCGQLPSASRVLSQSRAPPSSSVSSSATLPPASSTSSPASSSAISTSASAPSASISASVSSVISTFAVESASSSISITSTWSSASSTPTPFVSSVSSTFSAPQPTSSYVVTTEEEEDCDEEEDDEQEWDDEPITPNDTPVSAQSYGYTPSWTPSSSSLSPSATWTPPASAATWTSTLASTWTPAPIVTEAAVTAYNGETTVVLETVFVVEKTVTVTAPAVTITQTQTQTQTITEDGECAFTAESIPSAAASSAVWTPTPKVSEWVAPSSTSSWTPEPTSSWYSEAAIVYSTSTSSPAPTSISSTAPTASAVLSHSVAPSPSPSSAPAQCGVDQNYDIELDLCVDICLGVLNILGVCVEADVGVGADLPVVGSDNIPVLGDLVGGLL